MNDHGTATDGAIFSERLFQPRREFDNDFVFLQTRRTDECGGFVRPHDGKIRKFGLKKKVEVEVEVEGEVRVEVEVEVEVKVEVKVEVEVEV